MKQRRVEFMSLPPAVNSTDFHNRPTLLRRRQAVLRDKRIGSEKMLVPWPEPDPGPPMPSQESLAAMAQQGPNAYLSGLYNQAGIQSLQQQPDGLQNRWPWWP